MGARVHVKLRLRWSYSLTHSPTSSSLTPKQLIIILPSRCCSVGLGIPRHLAPNQSPGAFLRNFRHLWHVSDDSPLALTVKGQHRPREPQQQQQEGVAPDGSRPRSRSRGRSASRNRDRSGSRGRSRSRDGAGSRGRSRGRSASRDGEPGIGGITREEWADSVHAFLMEQPGGCASYEVLMRWVGRLGRAGLLRRLDGRSGEANCTCWELIRRCAHLPMLSMPAPWPSHSHTWPAPLFACIICLSPHRLCFLCLRTVCRRGLVPPPTHLLEGGGWRSLTGFLKFFRTLWEVSPVKPLVLTATAHLHGGRARSRSRGRSPGGDRSRSRAASRGRSASRGGEPESDMTDEEWAISVVNFLLTQPGWSATYDDIRRWVRCWSVAACALQAALCYRTLLCCCHVALWLQAAKLLNLPCSHVCPLVAICLLNQAYIHTFALCCTAQVGVRCSKAPP